MTSTNTALNCSPHLVNLVDSSLRIQSKDVQLCPLSTSHSPRRNFDLLQNAFHAKNSPALERDQVKVYNSTAYVLESEKAAINTPFIQSIHSSCNLFGEVLIDSTYEIIHELGKGTFGKVYLAKKRCAEEHVAIKKIDMSAIKNNREKKNISRELRLLKILHHPNIIKVIDIIETKSSTFIIMENCCKGELHDYITSKGRLSEQEARPLFRQIVSAIDYCHEVNFIENHFKSSIVHRDLKPENLLLKNDCKTVKLIDFGFGNTWNEHGFLNTFCGSPFYAAPEMTQGIEYVGPEVDIWSLGVILYMMLTGELPFQGSSIPELYASIAKGEYSIPPYLSSDAIFLLRRILDIQPRRRASLEEIKNHPWTNIGYRYGPTSGVPYRPNCIDILDEETLRELTSLGYTKYEYYQEFKSNQRTPIKNLYHLHYEWLQRLKEETKKKDISESPNNNHLADSTTAENTRLKQTTFPGKMKHTSFWTRILGKTKTVRKKCPVCVNISCVCHFSEKPTTCPQYISNSITKILPL